MSIYQARMSKTAYLQHHGIKGQKWGDKNGPPYPLDAGDHSASEKKAGWRKSLDKSGKNDDTKSGKSKSQQNEKRGLTSGQKKALVIGGTVLAASIALYAAKKMGALDKASINRGLDFLTGKSGNQTVDNILNSKYSATTIRKTISESLQSSLMKTNPLCGTTEGTNNCVPSAIAGILRTMGYNAEAASTGGKMLNLGGVLEDCFKGIKVYDGYASKFAKSPEDAAEMLVKRFGNNAKGVVNIKWARKDLGGHAFSWIITNGKVQFLDFQNGYNDQTMRRYWSSMDIEGSLQFAQISDNMQINFDKLLDYIHIE